MAEFEHPFVSEFRRLWASPTLDGLMSPLSDDIILCQPFSPPLKGKSAARREFQKILVRFPGLHGQDVSGLGTDNEVFINWSMVIPAGKRPVIIPVVDHFRLKQGKVIRRDAYFDPTIILAAALKRPKMWPGLIRQLF